MKRLSAWGAFLSEQMIKPMMKPPPYPEVNAVLADLTRDIREILGENLVGLYLTGSLSYDDFNSESSDIDLVAILQTPASLEHLTQLEKMHVLVEEKHPQWAKRIEASYTPLEMLSSIVPPQAPRPYYGEGIFYREAGYGNEWIINNHWLYHAGVTLAGADFRTLTPAPAIAEVQKASLRDLFREWEPKLREPEWLDNPHYQSYLVVNLCRIVYTVMAGKIGSKAVSAAWVKGEYPQWKVLIEAAEVWRYGEELHRQTETLHFLRFVIGIVSETVLYKTLQTEK